MTTRDALCARCGKTAITQAGKPLCQTCYAWVMAQDWQAMGETIDLFLADLGAVPKDNWSHLFIYLLQRLEELDGNIGWLLAEIEAELAQKTQHGVWYVWYESVGH